MTALFIAAVAALCIPANAQEKGKKTLVAYFSATGTTENVARMIADATGGTLYEIEPAKEYSSRDLDWHDKSSRSSVEMADSKARPDLKKKQESLNGYDVIYIGFPIWWDLAPRIVNTFIESWNFEGKTVIPFATSGGSSISNSEKELKKSYPELDWRKGRLLNSPDKDNVREWVETLKAKNR